MFTYVRQLELNGRCVVVFDCLDKDGNLGGDMVSVYEREVISLGMILTPCCSGPQEGSLNAGLGSRPRFTILENDGTTIATSSSRDSVAQTRVSMV